MAVAEHQPRPEALAHSAAILVTGGSSGLGAAVVDAVERDGGTPVVLDRVRPRRDVDAELVDLEDTRAAEAAVGIVAKRHGGLAGVVAAAGIDVCGPLASVAGEQWERVVAVNLLGTAAVVRAAMPSLEQSRGRIVTVTSTLGLAVCPDATAYCASKFGIVGFTRALTVELAGRVGVTLLIPGAMRTAFFDGHPEQYKPASDSQLNPPENVAEAVLFALRQPPGCDVRELIITPSTEPSWP